MRARSRECDRGTEDLDCVGDDSQTLDCEGWKCPGKYQMAGIYSFEQQSQLFE